MAAEAVTERQALEQLVTATWHSDGWMKHSEAFAAALTSLGWWVNWSLMALHDQDGAEVQDPFEDEPDAA